MGDEEPIQTLATFARDRGLEFERGGVLPARGSLLERDSLEVLASAGGTLPGELLGTLAQLAYTYRSSDATRTKRLTAVVTLLPESIGFAPMLSGGAAEPAAGVKLRKLKPAEGVTVHAASGVDQSWLTELLSPALSHWLARSPEGFGWELVDGVLTVFREEHLTAPHEIERLCLDAAHLAGAIRKESLEEVETGGAERAAAHEEADNERKFLATIVPQVKFAEPPADVAAAVPAYRDLIKGKRGTYFVGAMMGLGWALVVNVIGAGIFGLLLSVGDTLVNVLAFEVVTIGVATLLSTRHLLSSWPKRCAEEAFFREYAGARGLTIAAPLAFAATHAKAKLPGKPTRVLSGVFHGANGGAPVAGSLLLTGDGSKRGHVVALVAGPEGPSAQSDLDVSPPGLSARLLDSYSRRLADELGAVAAVAPAA